MRITAGPLRRDAKVKRLRIAVWQTHRWAKVIIKKNFHCKRSNNLRNPLRNRINIMKTTEIMNHGKSPLRLAIYSLAACAICCSPLALANVANISIVNFAFTPSSVSINVNDSVKWTWAGSPHSTTSDTGLWESGVQGTGATFTHTFASAGSFPFHCSVHPFMTGTITVQEANVPPTVTLTTPADGSVFAAPASFTLNAKASDSDGTVTNVQFLQGASVLENSITPPYSASVSNLPAGTYTFSAVAADNGGGRATNTITISVVTPGPINLSAPQFLAPASFQFSYSATVGLRYVIQRSSDLAQWTGLSTNTAEASSIVFTDQKASGDQGFYRVGLLPNP